MNNYQLLELWKFNCRRSQIANYTAANSYSRFNLSLGVPAIALSALVSTSVFVALAENEINQYAQIAVGLVSVLATVLAALQTFLKWGELAAKCRASGAEYGSIKRQIDQVIAASKNGGSITDDDVNDVREQMDTLARESPEIPERIWNRVRKETAHEKPK